MDEDFAVFIMVWGRPEKMWTYQSLRKHGYTGKIYFVADDLDETLEGYKEKYGDDLLIFSKEEMQDQVDAGDNTGDLRSTLYAANIIPSLAKKLGIKYFFIFCDDYTRFNYRMDGEYKYIFEVIKDLDKVFSFLLEYYKSIPASSIAIAQGGDFVGGKKNNNHESLGTRRKVMNTFLCSTERPFSFLGRMNEDVTTYTNLGNKGYLFLTYPNLSVEQRETQNSSGGLTDIYLKYGTYTKSFFPVMYSPSSISIFMFPSKHSRLHHKVSWSNTVPSIISEEHRK